MFSSTRSKVTAAAAAAVVIAGGSYGIVTATSGSASAAPIASSSSPGRRIRIRQRLQRPVRSGRGRVSRHDHQRVLFRVHADHRDGPEGDHQGGVRHYL